MRLNIESLDKEVNGILRLFSMCQSILSLDESSLNENDIKFIFDTVEFLGARAFSDYSTTMRETSKRISAGISIMIHLGKIHSSISKYLNNEVKKNHDSFSFFSLF